MEQKVFKSEDGRFIVRTEQSFSEEEFVREFDNLKAFVKGLKEKREKLLFDLKALDFEIERFEGLLKQFESLLDSSEGR